MPKTIDLVSTGFRISARLAHKPRQRYGFFDQFLLAVIGACEVAKKPNIFLPRSNQLIQEINRNFDGTLNHYGPILFA